MPSNWSRCRRSVRSNLEITREQLLHPFFILNDQHDVHRFHTDLQPPAPARNRDERRRTPTIRRAAGGYAFSSFTSEDEAAFDHVRHNRYALCVLQYFFRDSLVWHSHNFVQHLAGVVQSLNGIFPRRPCPAQCAETHNRKYEHYLLHGTTSFLPRPGRQVVWRGGQTSVLRRKQIRSLAAALLCKMEHLAGHQTHFLLTPGFPDLEPSSEWRPLVSPIYSVLRYLLNTGK